MLMNMKYQPYFKENQKYLGMSLIFRAYWRHLRHLRRMNMKIRVQRGGARRTTRERSPALRRLAARSAEMALACASPAQGTVAVQLPVSRASVLQR
ncbi:hypothetical protein [Paenibacillus sp. 1P07SE]|uniref:hypothetical protein n=1 Tax=Paenibacillus sp. 1P07SE TaxID=3132209 RepID=UPI0039A4FD63